ncbi:hypothetical protein LguiB_010926 [Lonicera macranthoides]
MVCVILLQACQEIHPRSARSVGSASSPRTSSVGRGGSLGEKNDNNNEQKEVGLVVCFGEMLIDFVPTVSGVSLADAPGFKKAPGGAPANVAVDTARLGGSSAFIGKNNVDNSGMWFDANARTALAFVTLRSNGEHEFMFFRNPSADMLLAPPELDCNLINKVSKEEITFITGGDDAYDNVVWNMLFHPNLKLLIVTEGADGCRYYTKEFHGRVSGVEVKCIDTTGAGDAFVGGLLHYLASDLNLYKDEEKLKAALKFANVCGALTVTQKGAIPALPTKEAVLQVLNKS